MRVPHMVVVGGGCSFCCCCSLALCAMLAGGLVPRPNTSLCVTVPCSAASEVPKELVLVDVLKQPDFRLGMFLSLSLRRLQQTIRANRSAALKMLAMTMPATVPLLRAELAGVLAGAGDGDEAGEVELVVNGVAVGGKIVVVGEPSDPGKIVTVSEVVMLIGGMAVSVDISVAVPVTKTVGAAVITVRDITSITDVTVVGSFCLFSWPESVDGASRFSTAVG